MVDDDLHAAVRALVVSLDQCARLAKMTLDAGADERRVQLEEREAVATANAVRRVVELLGRSLGDPEVKRAVRLALADGDVVDGQAVER